MKSSYVHVDIPEISTGFLKDGDVIVKNYDQRSYSDIMEVAIMTYRIALRLGIKAAVKFNPSFLPYDTATDNLVFEAPLNSVLFGRQINFLRGWKQFESCIKGFNAIGLMAEQIINTRRRLANENAEGIIALKKQYLYTREANGAPIFEKDSLENVSREKFGQIDLLDLAIWLTFGNKTIVCSTSSNMGISLHDALRYMQKAPVRFMEKEFKMLNQNEGGLIIWCPDEQADFMNEEKTAFLRKLEAELPKLTKLRTYINRQQRDPGALRDALLCGGYFFPTNPQSKDEIQNLLFFSLTEIAKERGQAIAEIVKEDNIKYTLQSLRCEIEKGKIYVMDGAEGGISGLMVPYLIMLEELLPISKVKAVSTWNQASIGAALAAAILADKIIRTPECLNESVRSELYSAFPGLSAFLDSKKLGRDVKSSIHGVFDLANIQSLAQLLGVVVQRHLSGRGTAFVGLGSSSYSNGNRCYEILKESADTEGAFLGKPTFHPATHTLNPFAQALIYSEDLYRVCNSAQYRVIVDKNEQKKFLRSHIRKTEPAGAAAMAGYILSRLDTGTLSIIEIAYFLNLMGFSRNYFLKFAKHMPNEQGFNLFLQESYEEGVYMGDLSKNILLFLDWPLKDLEKKAEIERAHSRLKYKLYPLDLPSIDNLNPKVNIYLTGDNTFQPDDDFIEHCVESLEKNKEKLEQLLKNYYQEVFTDSNKDMITYTSDFFIAVTGSIDSLDKGVNRLMKRTLNFLVNNKVNKINTKV